MSAIHAENFTEQFFRVISKGYLRVGKISYSDDNTEREYKLYDKKHNFLVAFRARPLPGCCGILVVYYLRPATGKKDSVKIFKDTLDLIVKAAGLAKFGNVLLTQTEESLGNKAIDQTLPFTYFTNWKTNNKINVYQIKTEKPTEKPATTFEGE